jgi:micrococcal nuclease
VRYRLPVSVGLRRWLALLTVLLATAVAYGWRGQPAERPPAPQVATALHGRVVRVVDGDTVDVQLPSGKRRVRLIGIDTPEMHPSQKLDRDIRRTGQDREHIVALGKQASDFTRRHVDGKEVDLELDGQHDDEYGRLLAYVRLPDGTLLNALLLREGYAQVYTRQPNLEYVVLLVTLEREARAANRGLWANGMSAR